MEGELGAGAGIIDTVATALLMPGSSGLFGKDVSILATSAKLAPPEDVTEWASIEEPC
jgi:hypothetical protein